MSEQTLEGTELIEDIRRKGYAVSHAYWLYTAEAGQWFLYLVSDDLLKNGPTAAYRIANGVLRGHPFRWIDPFSVKVVGSDDPTAKALGEWLKGLNRPAHSRIRGVRLGDVDIEQAYVYTT